ncbi:MAG: endonuclease III [Candidatus Pacebacteria bacterium]|nr:endonuclease III [Candidatus Paceibacterota bacterium]
MAAISLKGKDAIDQIFARLAAQTPEPRTELNYSNDYTLLVAVVLSAQSTDVGVNRATAGLFALADSPARMVALGLEGIKQNIRSLGLFNAKAANVLALSEILVRDFGGEVPHSRESLESLPGVGRKTANVVLNTAFGEPTLAVDTHIFRLAHRLGFSNGKTPAQVETDLLAIIPMAYRLHAHHWLILHGRYCCTARKPKCSDCIVAELCPSFGKV